MKQKFKRFLSWTLALLMALSLLPAGLLSVPAHAASGTVTGLNDPEIGVSYSGDSEGSWRADGTGITGSVISTTYWVILEKTHATTLTIKNNKNTSALLMFDYAVDLQGGTVKVAGESVSSGKSYSGELAAGGSIEIYLKSGSTSSPTTIRISNILLIASGVRVKTTFSAPEYCSYTVNAGANGTHSLSNGSTSKEFTQSSTAAYQLTAYPTEGYRFLGWYNLTKEQYISTEAETSMYFDTPCTITARFAAEDAAIFETGGQPFADLGEAISYASEHGKDKITLIGSGSIDGAYTIPKEITLLIPFDEAGTTYTDVPGYTTTEDKTRTAFRKLTMEEGASIIVEGAISVGGKHYTSSGAQCCKTTGPYGQIQMEAGSGITLENGANLYAWGYITGDGQITANSGAAVYEYFQIMDWRGGNCTKTMAEDAQTVFPFSQYYVQNIEAALTIEAGANEYAYISVTAALVGTQNATIPFVGANGLFKLLENGRFTKKYIPAEDRMSFEIEGPAVLNSIALTVMGVSVDSSSYVLPINNNVDMQILSGTTTVSKDAALLPGVAVSIAEGAELKVADSANLYVYDAEQWGDYCSAGNKKFIPISYSPSKRYTRTQDDLIDAEIDVNGTLTAAGAIYTTEGGANICSSKGAGVYVQQGQPGQSSETYQCIQDDRTPNYTAIPITPAKLHNGDGSYEETEGTEAGTTINYVNGVWGGTAACMHTETEVRDAKPATCAQEGYTGDTYCKSCGEKIATGTTIPKTQNHAWDNGTVTTAATCTVAGVKTFTCSACNATKTETIPANGHTGGETIRENEVAATCTKEGSYDEVVYCTVCKAEIRRSHKTIEKTAHTEAIDAAVEPTCTTPGKTEGKHCSVCNEVLVAQKEVPAKGHTPGEAIRENEVAATCAKEGSYDEVVYCTVCKTEIRRSHKTIEKTAHTEVTDAAVEPTCTEPGKTEGKHCSVCNEILVEQKEIPVKGHTEVTDAAVEATCTEPGKTEGKHCSVCNEILVEQKEIPAKGHTEVIDAAVEPTCTKPGKTEGKHCSVCNTVLVAQKEVPVKGHTEVTDAAVEPTCTKPGKTEGKHCSVCNEVIVAQKEIPAKGHTPGEAIRENEVAATCTKEGSYDEVVYCTVCKTEISRTKKTVEKTAHTEVIDAAVEATCTEPGKTEGKHCSVCNEVIVAQKEIPAKGHTPGEAIRENEVAATCTKEGSYDEVVYCTVCKTEISRSHKTIEKTAHTEAIDAAVEPTCTVPGKTEGKHCSVCNEVIIAQTEIPAKGHQWEDATCTAPKTCSVCKITEGEANGHTWDEGAVTTAATCTATGVKTFTCSVCKETKTEDIPASGHQWEDATCTAPKTCSVCKITEGEAKGHTWDEGAVTTAATCTSTGVKTFTCSVCKETKTEDIPASGHQWEDATCTAPKTCSVCSATDGNPLGHIFGKWRVTKAADYVTPGEKTHTCSVCNAAETGAIPSILQQLKDLEITATKDGYTMTLPTGKKVLVLLAGYSGVGQLKSIQVLSVGETGEVSFALPSGASVVIFFLQEDYKPLCSRKVTQ